MKEKAAQPCCEKFKTMIGGQALIEGIMMRGPEKDAIVVRTSEGLNIDLCCCREAEGRRLQTGRKGEIRQSTQDLQALLRGI